MAVSREGERKGVGLASFRGFLDGRMRVSGKREGLGWFKFRGFLDFGMSERGAVAGLVETGTCSGGVTISRAFACGSERIAGTQFFSFRSQWCF
jgi:hypothetical protein